MIEGFLNYLVHVCVISAEILALLLLPGLIIGVLIQILTSKLRTYAGNVTGIKFFVYFTFLGTVVHELGHAVFGKIFRRKILEMKLFSPKESEDGGMVLGYVSFAPPTTLYQRVGDFFIGIGPIWFGAFAIYILTVLLFPELLQELEGHADPETKMTFWENCKSMTIASFNGIPFLFSEGYYKHWQTWLWLYLTLSVGLHLTLSAPDLKFAKSGLIVLVGIILVINFFTAWMDTPFLLWLGDFRGMYGILIFTLVLVFVCSIIMFFFKMFKPVRKTTIWIYKKMPSTWSITKKLPKYFKFLGGIVK